MPCCEHPGTLFSPSRWVAAKRGLDSPVFIIGCGRSGTSILGETLAHHEQIAYLNERRDLWIAAYPQTDIWSEQAAARGGRLHLDATHGEPTRSARLRRSFWRRLWRARASVLLEKLPANSFRLRFLAAIFPQARYIHLYRSGLEVAHSIARRYQGDPWHGADGYKWQQLLAHARVRGIGEQTIAACTGMREQGLLEWRLSTEAVVEFLDDLHVGRYLELPYRSLVDRPGEQIARILDFLALADDPELRDIATDTIRAQGHSRDPVEPTDLERTLGGALLGPSIACTGGLVGWRSRIRGAR